MPTVVQDPEGISFEEFEFYRMFDIAYRRFWQRRGMLPPPVGSTFFIDFKNRG